MHPEPRPLAYHHAVVAHLREHLPAVWGHYASDSHRAEHEDALRLHLLQSTYALTRDSHADLYAVVDEVAEALRLGVRVELFQGEELERCNAQLLYQPGAARLVFHGPLRQRLSEDELRFLIGHELAHHKLWSVEGGDHLVAARALEGLAGLAPAGSAVSTARLLSLSTEVFCDREGVRVSSLEAGIRTLVKLRTSLSDVSAADFLTQSDELLERQGTGSRGWSHPEAHVRALAMRLLAEDDRDEQTQARVRSLIEGPLQLDALDLLRRAELTALTRELVGHLLAPAWFRTDAVLGHTRLLFDDDLPELRLRDLPEPEHLLAPWGDTVRSYLVAILLDYVAVDPGLGDLPLARAHQVAEALGLEVLLVKAVNQKLKRRRRDIDAALEDRDSQLEAAAQQVEEEG